MHIDVTTASLLAQVIPVLLLAVLFEGRGLRDFAGRSTGWLFTLYLTRVVGVIGGVVSVAVCVLVVVHGSWVSSVADWSVTITLAALLAAVLIQGLRHLRRDTGVIYRAAAELPEPHGDEDGPGDYAQHGKRSE